MAGEGSVRLAVVGGGIAGLAAARELIRWAAADRRPVTVDLYESTGRVGGVILTEYEDGLLLDAGPDSLLAFKPAAIELCREMGLGDDLIPTRPTSVGVGLYSRGKLRHLPSGFDVSAHEKILRFVGSGLISLPGLVRMAGDLVLPAGDPEDDRSMAEFFGRRLGREAVERLVDPLLAGIYAGDPHRLSIEATFPRFPRLVEERGSLLLAGLRRRGGRRPATGGAPTDGRKGSGSMFYTLRRGLGAMVCALADEVGQDRIDLNTHLESVVRTGGGFELRTSRGAGAGYRGVVLAVPAWSAASAVRDMAPELAARLEEIRYASSATVFLAYRVDDLEAVPRGHGFLVPSIEGRRINGATWVSNKYAGRAPDDLFLARCFVGGDRTGDELEADDAALIDMCRNELREIADLDAEPAFARVYRHTRAGPQYEVGHLARVERIMSSAGEHPGLELAGSAYRGVGIPDCVEDGQAAARRLIDSVRDG